MTVVSMVEFACIPGGRIFFKSLKGWVRVVVCFQIEKAGIEILMEKSLIPLPGNKPLLPKQQRCKTWTSRQHHFIIWPRAGYRFFFSSGIIYSHQRTSSTKQYTESGLNYFCSPYACFEKFPELLRVGINSPSPPPRGSPYTLDRLSSRNFCITKGSTFDILPLYLVTCQTRTALLKFSFRNLIVYFYYVS